MLVVWAWGAAWGAAPFSHRIHLQQGLDCTFCHALAPKSTAVEDNLLPQKQVCLNCHEDAVVPPRRPDTGPARLTRFSHALHLRMGDVAPFIAAAIDKHNYFERPGAGALWVRGHLGTKNPCEACHRGLEESDQVTSAALPEMPDCLVCHTQIDAPFSCEDCHAKNAALKPANHTEHFVDAHSSGKLKLDKTTCAVCHGRTFTCMGCH
ncbi:MAG TPA: cytochrome c3 family protein [Bryobacteraceae bacterium]|nr:cytochrome c3 family protein [Bryobacteraceae bacterium]